MTGVHPTYSQDRTPVRGDLAICPVCGNSLEFETDGMGNVGEHCPRCAELARLRASVRHLPAVTTEQPLLPPLPTPAKLESREELHRTATQPKKEGLAPATTTPPVRTEAKTPNAKRTYSPKLCPCGVTFTPTGPRSSHHAPDCPARPKPPARKRVKLPTPAPVAPNETLDLFDETPAAVSAVQSIVELGKAFTALGQQLTAILLEIQKQFGTPTS